MFDKYINDISKLNNFEKEDILNEKFLLIKEKNMNIEKDFVMKRL